MMAKMHRMPLDSSESTKGPCMWRKIRKFLDAVPFSSFSDDPKKSQRAKECGVMTKEQLEKELDEMEKELKDCGSPAVFCHNDLLLANIIYNEKEAGGKVTFIDLVREAIDVEIKRRYAYTNNVPPLGIRRDQLPSL